MVIYDKCKYPYIGTEYGKRLDDIYWRDSGDYKINDPISYQ